MRTIYTRAIILIVPLIFLLNSLRAQGLWTFQLKDFKAASRNGNVQLTWQTASEQNLTQFDIEYSEDGKYFKQLGFVPASNSLNGQIYEFEHAVSYKDSAIYRLRILGNNNKWLYSE